MLDQSKPSRFRSKLVKCKTLDSDQDSCCILNQSLDFLYCNRAWDIFARSNGGTGGVLGENLFARNLREFIPGVLQRFFTDQLSNVLGHLRIWDHFYECSSPTEFRIFRLQALPLPDAVELLLCHTLMHFGPHYRLPACFTSANVPVRMCSHCRRTAKDDDGLWLWVPEHLAQPPKDRINDLCTDCFAYYETGRAPWPEHVWNVPSWCGERSKVGEN